MADFNTLMEIVDRIRGLNQNDKKSHDRIPTTEDLYRKHLSDICSSADQANYFLRLLNEAHYLFRIHLVEPDDTLMVEGINAYVVAEVAIMRPIKDFANGELETLYEQQFYRRKQANVIIKELLPQVRTFNNTPLGRSLNMAMMTQQFEHILTEDFQEYTETWKKRKLRELMPDGNAAVGSDEDESADMTDAGAPPIPTVDIDDHPPSGIDAPERPPLSAASAGEQPLRAVDDSERLAEVQQMDHSGKWGEAVSRFGVQFLVRIHFRKYEFDKVRWLIRTGKIALESDLRYIRDTLRLMEGRTGRDVRLKQFHKDMAELKRIAQLRLNQIHQLRKQQQ